MTKDEALRLALETLEYAGPSWIEARQPAITAIKATLEANDEPLAYLQPTASPENACYTPPQRTWVGLTDEEANELWESTDSDWELMKRTEAKLKEKNT
jgi:hypothetical protein